MKMFILILTVLAAGAVNAADFSGSLKEVVLVQPCGDGDCNTVAKPLSEVQISEVEVLKSGRTVTITLNAVSPTKWEEGATIFDVAAVRLAVTMPATIPSFGASTTGLLSVLVKDGENRGVSTKTFAANCSISGTQNEVSCTSMSFGSPAHFLTISLSR